MKDYPQLSIRLPGEVKARLESTGCAALTQALAGMGGIGKTQTAIEYAYQYRENYRAVMWVSADTEITIRTSIVAIAAGLGEKDTSVIFTLIERLAGMAPPRA